MAFLEYMLLAILGSAPAAMPASAPILAADTVIQPHGGVVGDTGFVAGIPAQDTGGDKGASSGKPRNRSRLESTRNSPSHTKTRRSHKGHKGGKIVKTANKEPRQS
jgi:hypothetical protein